MGGVGARPFVLHRGSLPTIVFHAPFVTALGHPTTGIVPHRMRLPQPAVNEGALLTGVSILAGMPDGGSGPPLRQAHTLSMGEAREREKTIAVGLRLTGPTSLRRVCTE